MIGHLRNKFLDSYHSNLYTKLQNRLESHTNIRIAFRISETPIFLARELLEQISEAGAALTHRLLGWPEYMAAAEATIPAGYRVAGQTPHPNFLTADFALVETAKSAGEASRLEPRLVEIQAFPSIFALQEVLADSYRQVFDLPGSLHQYLSGLDHKAYWEILRRTIVGKHDPKHVVLTEVDPKHQKTLPDFLITARELGIAVVDIATLEPRGNKLHYRDASGELVPIHRIYNRAIADEMIARQIRLPFDLTAPWDVEWAGHPNWYFLISKFSVPWLAASSTPEAAFVPPAVFLDSFLDGPGRDRLAAAGLSLPDDDGAATIYDGLLLKPLFSFAGKGIQFSPSRLELESIPAGDRANYLLQQRMHFVPTIRTPYGPTQAEIRILYAWPDGGKLTALMPLVRLGRGKMMGVDHNRDLEWVGASAAFWE